MFFPKSQVNCAKFSILLHIIFLTKILLNYLTDNPVFEGKIAFNLLLKLQKKIFGTPKIVGNSLMYCTKIEKKKCLSLIHI